MVQGLAHDIPILVDRHAVRAPRLVWARKGRLGRIIVQLGDVAYDASPVNHAERLPRRDLEYLRDVLAAGVVRPHQERRGVELSDLLARPVGRDVQPPGHVGSIHEDHVQRQLVRLPQ